MAGLLSLAHVQTTGAANTNSAALTFSRRAAAVEVVVLFCGIVVWGGSTGQLA